MFPTFGWDVTAIPVFVLLLIVHFSLFSILVFWHSGKDFSWESLLCNFGISVLDTVSVDEEEDKDHSIQNRWQLR